MRWRLALVVAVAVCLQAGRAGAGWEPQAGIGALTGVRLQEVTFRPTVAGAATRWWSPGSRLDLGLQLGLGVTVLPYGADEGRAVLGWRTSYAPYRLDNEVTLLPRLAFAARLSITDAVSVVGGAGATFFESASMGGMGIFPFPTLLGAVQIALGAGERFALQIGLESMIVPVSPGGGLLGAGIALVWRPSRVLVRR